MTALEDLDSEDTYPREWLKDPSRAPSNMYAQRLSRMLQTNKGTCRSASKSGVKLVHTPSIYSQINVPICEVNKMLGLTPKTRCRSTVRRKQGPSHERNSASTQLQNGATILRGPCTENRANNQRSQHTSILKSVVSSDPKSAQVSTSQPPATEQVLVKDAHESRNVSTSLAQTLS